MSGLRDRVGHVLARTHVSRTGLVVGAWRDGEQIGLWERGELPAGAGSIFEIGSITKVFTATLLADMARDGLVGTDDRAPCICRRASSCRRAAVRSRWRICPRTAPGCRRSPAACCCRR